MSDLDLTEAVEAAARGWFESAGAHVPPYDDLDPMVKHRARETVLPGIIAAAPVIARQVGEQIAQAIDLACIDDGHTSGTGVCLRCNDIAALARAAASEEEHHA